MASSIWHSYRLNRKTQIHWIFIVVNLFWFAFPLISHIPIVTFCRVLRFPLHWQKRRKYTLKLYFSQSSRVYLVSFVCWPFCFRRRLCNTFWPVYFFFFISLVIRIYVSFCHWGKCIKKRHFFLCKDFILTVCKCCSLLFPLMQRKHYPFFWRNSLLKM